MPDKKISALTSLAQGDVAASTDVLPIVDTSATETKKITASALVGAGMTAGVTNVDINSGAIDGTTIGANFAAAGTFTNLTASGTVSFSGATVSNGGAVTTIDINGGTIDATSIGASSASTGAFTTLTTSSTVTLNGGTANGVLYLNGSKVATSGSALTFDGTNVDFGTVGAKINFPTTSSSTKNYVGGAADGFSLEMVTQRGAIQPISYKQDYSVGHVWSLTGSSAMALTSTGLGIGTSSPTQKLHIYTGSATGTYLRAENTGGFIFAGVKSTGVGYVATESNTALEIGTNGTVRATFDTSGNLGLGVTPSAWSTSYYKVIEGGDSGNQGAVGFRTDANGVELFANAYFNGTNNIYKFTGAAGLYQNTGGTHAWLVAPSGTAGNTISFTQAMTLDASGNLGVGTTSPNIGGVNKAITVNSATSTNCSYELSVNNVLQGSLFTGISTSSVALYTVANGPLLFGTNNTERARITSGGDFLFGVTAFANNKLCVAIRGETTGATDESIRCAVPSTSSTLQIGFYNSNGRVGSVSTDGSNTAFNTSSDRRLKENICLADEAGNVIDSIEVVKHDWKVGGHTRYGVIAQDLHKVAPEAVTPGDNGEKVERAWGVDYSKLVPMLVKEIQSLRARVAQLESK